MAIFDGRPVRPDLEKLNEALTLQDGELVTHKIISAIIGERHGTSRYRTVTTAWKRYHWQNHQRQIEAEPGIGYRVLTANQAVSSAVSGMHKVTRVSRKVGARARAVDVRNMPADRKELAGIVIRFTDAVVEARRVANKAIATPAPVAAPLQLVPNGKS